MKKSLRHILIAGALLSSMAAFAQHKPIDTIEYHVVEMANANIANGAKINNNPSVADTTKPSRKVDYSTLNSQFSTSYAPQSLQPMQLKGEPLDPLQHSILYLGGGNYNTAYGEYFLNSLRSKDWDYGIHLNHYSSNYTTSSEGYSFFDFNDVNLYAKKYFPFHTLTAQADYDERSVHDFGYNTSENHLFGSDDVTRERYNLFNGAIQYTSRYKDSSKVSHDIKVGYYNYSDLYSTTENNLDITANLFAFVQKLRIDVKAVAQYYRDNNSTITGGFYTPDAWNLGINPYVSTVEPTWDAHIGLKAYLDAINGGTMIFPDLIARYHVADNLVIIYAGIDGDRTYNSYRSLTTTNPFLENNVNLMYTNTVYHVFVGFTGNVTNQITYDISGSESEIKNMPLFITDTTTTLKNQFTVVYDDVQQLNIHADIGYRMKENVRFTLGGDWYNYMATNQLEAWYHPTLKLNLLGEYTLQKKYVLSANLFYFNQQFAPEIVDNVLIAKTLAGYPDINLGVDYKYSKFFTAFLHLNNIANIAYQQWDDYPTQRFNFMLGVKLAF